MPTRIDPATEATIEAALRIGIKPKEILKMTGVSRSMVYKVSYTKGIPIKKPKPDPGGKRQARRKQLEAIASRNRDIVTRFEQGETLEGIGKVYGITRERVRQITSKAGMTSRRLIMKQRLADTRALLESRPMTPDEATEALGVDKRKALEIARRFGVTLIQRRVWDNPTVAALAEKVKAGESIRHAAGADPKIISWLSAYCAHYGIQLSHGWHSRRLPRNPKKDRTDVRAKAVRVPPEKVAAVKEAARRSYGKEPASAVAARCGVTRNAIIGYWFRMRQSGEL